MRTCGCQVFYALRILKSSIADHERTETLPLSDIPAIVQQRAQTALADAQSAKQKAKEESRSDGEEKLSERSRKIEAETEKLALVGSVVRCQIR